MPILIMMCGVPGSGKTTARRELVAEGDMWCEFWDSVLTSPVVISSDDIVHYLCDNHNISYEEGWKLFIKDAADITKNLLKYNIIIGADIVVDMTNLTKAKRNSIIETVNKYSNGDYSVICYDLTGITKKEMLKRNEGRTDHTIPEEVLLDMHDSIEKPSKVEKFDIIHNFDELLDLIDTFPNRSIGHV